MKAPNIVDLETLSADGGSESDRKRMTKKKAAPKVKAPKTESAKPRTFSLRPAHDKIINDMAAKLSKERGKPVTGSEALRHLLELAGGVK